MTSKCPAWDVKALRATGSPRILGCDPGELGAGWTHTLGRELKFRSSPLLGDLSKERTTGIIWDVLEVPAGQESAANGPWRCQKPGEFGTGLAEGTQGSQGTHPSGAGGPVDTPELSMDALWHLDPFPKRRAHRSVSPWGSELSVDTFEASWIPAADPCGQGSFSCLLRVRVGQFSCIGSLYPCN